MRNYKFIWVLVLSILMLGGVNSCSSENSEPEVDTFDVDFVLPAGIDTQKGGIVSFVVRDGKAPETTDLMYFTTDDGISRSCTITETSSASFSVKLSNGIVEGDYSVSLKRGSRRKEFGKTHIAFVKQVEFTPDEGTTVWGVVSCGDKGVANVVVSDGYLTTTTNTDGIYQLKSEKTWGYVFISIPSGYEVSSKGVLPQFYTTLKSDAKTLERADFTLAKVEGQDNFRMYIFGDMHLANRTNDKAQFKVFTNDLNKYLDSHKSGKSYGLTLGDMTWDLYWYSRVYEFPQYLDEINSQVSGLQIFHTMGNHDNDFKAKNDFDAAFQYVRDIAPTYYSYNIGKIHFIVLDDIDCSDYDGTQSRNYEKNFTSDQLDWLLQDLSYVDKSTPLVITAHAQIFYPKGNNSFALDGQVIERWPNTKKLLNILKGYTVHFVTGHTHTIFNALPSETAPLGAENVFEHNAGSICASWWWSGYLTPGVYVSLDGAPAGYSIWEFAGKDIKWKYKAVGMDENYQFRAYDLNNVSFSYSDVPNISTSTKVQNAFDYYVKAYPKNSNNEVLINIWNWNSNWKLSVTDETGKELKWTQTVAYDPLHIAALTVKRFDNATLTSAPSFITEKKMHHFFKVKADNADVDLTIKVTDEFGNVYIENMKRPKAFVVDDYKAK